MKRKFLSFPYGEYIGQCNSDSKPHGNGVFEYFDGGLYKGEWKNGKYHGKGKIIFIINDVLSEGGYKKWEKSKFRIEQLKKYKKYWKEMHGYGLALKEENFHINHGEYGELKGIWNNNQIKHGVKTSTNSGNKYIGEFKNNRENGKGKILWKNLGDKKFSKFPYGGYFGLFKNGNWHGEGKFIDVYEDRIYLGEEFEKKRVEGDRIVAEWFGKWRNGYETGKYLINVYYFNSKQKLVFKRVIDAKFKKGGTSKREVEYWNIKDKL